jgi:peptidoglycan/xylan/chitin deacetylase (PgdA/CDA1 family)
LARPVTPLPWLTALLLSWGCGQTVQKRLENTGHLESERAAKAQKDLQRSADLPPAPPQASVVPEVVSHGSRTERQIALTFDACSTRDVSQYDEPVTDVLIRTRTPATIFLGGSWAREEAAHVRKLASNPLFELGNHSYTHPHMTQIREDARVRQELERTQQEVFALTGVTPKLFRPPYGEYDDRLVKTAAQLGLTTIEYDLASGDPDQHATKERLVEWVLKKAQPGSIVVMHINHLKFHTAEALPEIIQKLRQRGYTLVTVSELLRASHGDEAASARK